MSEKHPLETGDALRIEWTGHSWSYFREGKGGGRLNSMTNFKTFDEAVADIKEKYDLPSG